MIWRSFGNGAAKGSPFLFYIYQEWLYEEGINCRSVFILPLIYYIIIYYNNQYTDRLGL